ncbi:MAG: hypothetical protein LBF95_10775 [Treponema sp.]|jgi:hypothetical protein|nr:hypothetical protein [Treponema sp.]
MGRVGKYWTRTVTAAVCIAACYILMFLVFVPRILHAFGTAAVLVLAIPSFVCWTLLFLSLAGYKKYHYPVRTKVENLIHFGATPVSRGTRGPAAGGGKAPFFLPKSLVKIYREINGLEGLICSIGEKNRITNDYIRMLKKNTGDSGAKRLLEKYRAYDTYFDEYYAGCCSAYLNMRFQFCVNLIKEILIPRGNMHALDIEQFIKAVKADLAAARSMLTDNAFFDRGPAMETAKGTAQKKSPEQDANDGVILDEIGKTMKAIDGKIQHITTYLITAQSQETIGGTSPVDEKGILDIYREYDFEMDMEHIKKLEDEFDRFTAEKEVLGV